MIDGVREAAWLTTEETEILLARHEGTVVSPEFFRRGKSQTATILIAVGLFGLAVKAASLNPAYVPFAIVAVAGMSLGLIPLVLHWEARQAAARLPDVELREGFGRGAGRFVELIIRQGNAPTGEDRGMLWFEDGKMYFSGHRTSFGLVPSQVGSYPTQEEPVPRVRQRVNLVLKRATAAGPMSISFGLPLVSEAQTQARHLELRTDIEKWMKMEGAGGGQWPPSSPGPLVVSDRRLLTETAGWGLALPILLAALVSPITGPFFALLGAVVVSCVFWFTLGNDVRWRALRDRKRLREGR